MLRYIIGRRRDSADPVGDAEPDDRGRGIHHQLAGIWRELDLLNTGPSVDLRHLLLLERRLWDRWLEGIRISALVGCWVIVIHHDLLLSVPNNTKKPALRR